ncbi:MAG: VapC toxin family PIN domain ribonuclease [Verrucomicrobia bacterium]|nr:MAG: VapC toxin family PIN domain ribonuclease [Verrucomicrobiota bacterium]
MGVIFDTSVLIALERGALDPDRLVQGREQEPFGISVISAAELLHGVHRADTQKRRIKRSSYVEKVLELYAIYPFELGAARIYAELWATLQRKGVRIGAHDLMIAATAISLGWTVATLDLRDYRKIEGLMLETVG